MKCRPSYQCQGLDFCGREIKATFCSQSCFKRDSPSNNPDKFSQLVPESCSFYINVKNGENHLLSMKCYFGYTRISLPEHFQTMFLLPSSCKWNRLKASVNIHASFIFVHWVESNGVIKTKNTTADVDFDIFQI